MREICSSLALALLLPLAAAAQPASRDDLVSVYKLAEQAAPDVIGAQANYMASQARRSQAIAQLLPQLNGTGAYGSTDETLQGDLFGLSNLDGEQSFNTTAGVLTLTQLIYDRKEWVDADMAKQRSLISEAALQSSRNTLVLSVATAYFNLLQAEDELRLAQSDEDSTEEQQRQAGSRYKIGLVAQTAVKDAEARHAQSEASVVIAGNQVDVRRAELQRLTGQWHTVLARLGDGVRPALPAPNDREFWLDRGRSGNPDVRAARLGVQVADLNVSKAWGGFWPTLSVEGTARYNDTDGGFGGANTQRATGARVLLNLPLFASGGTAAQVREANYLLESAQATLNSSLSNNVLQVTSSFLGIGASLRKVEAYLKARDATQAALASTQVGQRLGTRTQADVLAARQAAAKAERDYGAAMYEYVLNTLRLKTAAGDIKPGDLAAVNQWLK